MKAWRIWVFIWCLYADVLLTFVLQATLPALGFDATTTQLIAIATGALFMRYPWLVLLKLR